MAVRIEKKLELTESCAYDYSITDGDFTHDNSYDTDIIVSLMCDRRATKEEIQQPELRRGWHGDVDSTLRGYLIGSKIWLLFQSRLTQDTVNTCENYAKDALSWVTEKNIADRVNVTGYRTGTETIVINIYFYVGIEEKFQTSYELWLNSSIPTSRGDT